MLKALDLRPLGGLRIGPRSSIRATPFATALESRLHSGLEAEARATPAACSASAQAPGCTCALLGPSSGLHRGSCHPPVVLRTFPRCLRVMLDHFRPSCRRTWGDLRLRRGWVQGMHQRHVNNSGGGLTELVGDDVEAKAAFSKRTLQPFGDAGSVVHCGERITSYVDVCRHVSSISAAGVVRQCVVPEDVLSGSATAAFQLGRERQVKTEPSESLKLFRCESGTAIVLQRKVCHPGAPEHRLRSSLRRFVASRSKVFASASCTAAVQVFLRRPVLQCRVTNDIPQLSRGPPGLQWSSQFGDQRAEDVQGGEKNWV